MKKPKKWVLIFASLVLANGALFITAKEADARRVLRTCAIQASSGCAEMVIT
ncbi:MAG: hypothetical protein RJQ04_07255 [Longimicrobiales bacterium]